MWLYKSYRDFILEATGACAQKGSRTVTAAESCVEIIPGPNPLLKLPVGKWPPVIVVKNGQLDAPPMLEGRHRQQLPQVPGRIRGRLLAGAQNNEHFSQEQLRAWFVPCRVGTDEMMTISVGSGTILRFNVSEWPAHDDQQIQQIRRAANILQKAPDMFATVPSIANAYVGLEADWKDSKLGERNPQVELLVRHARQLRSVFEDLCARPRAILHTEHRMQKLQNVRRIDAKTLQWLLAQPGRNTAERAGARQRIKAPKRYETISTLENRVLRAFAALTVRATKALLTNTKEITPHKEILKAHHFRARRIETMLRERNVPEAHDSVRPNFPLRFDPRYNKIWRAWLELRRESFATELDWMWQHRTFMEILGFRAAMIFHQRTLNSPDDGNVAHCPVQRTSNSMHNQGSHLDSDGIKATFRIRHKQSGKDNIHEFRTVNSDDDLPLGAIATIEVTSRVNSTIWWNVPECSDNSTYSVGVEALPWNDENSWEANLNKWIDWVVS